MDNGVPVYGINMGTQEVVKIEIVFNAGRPYERKKLAARTTAAMHKEGTRYRDFAAIAEHFDFYGSTLSVPFSMDFSHFVLYSLNKHIDKVLPLLAEILEAPSFPQTELDAFIMRNQQRLQVDLTKNDVVANRHITELIFGKDHPYGYNSYMETYADLRREDLIRHRDEFYTAGNCSIFISGKINPGMSELLNRYLGNAIPKGPPAAISPIVEDRCPEQVKIEHPDKVQTAIRIGRRLFNRHHSDFNGLFVLSTILGGYFGSRLMANIREEKGYTYNIYSTLDAMRFDGFLSIGTEVGNEFAADTLKQIYIELEELQEDPVSREELEMVRNYLLGNFLTMLDGPFNVAETIRNFITDELPLTCFDDMVRAVREIDAEELQQLARKYLRREDLWEVAVGNI